MTVISILALSTGKKLAEAISELQDKSGQDFDPHIVKAFIESVLPSAIEAHNI